MGQKTEEKILDLYYEFPEKKFTVRSISKLTNIPKSTVHKKLNNLNVLLEKNKSLFKIKKVNYFTEKLFEIGLIDFLIKELNPSCIILFGSLRKGDSTKESDIDLFVESFVNKKLNLTKFEKKIGHKIDLFVESNINNLQENLLNNVINGIKLFGSIKLK